MNVVHSIASFRLNDGGPPRSIGQICDRLSEYDDLSVNLLFGEFDRSERAPVSTKVHCVVAPYIHRYNEKPLSSALFYKKLCDIHEARRVSLVHQHGLWLRQNYETAKFAHNNNVPHVVAPRGMLEPWALGRNGMLKKFFWVMHQHKDLKRCDGFHATASEEANSIRALGFKQPIAVIPNGVELQPTVLRKPKGQGATKTALFLSRINPKKGLIMLLDAWKKLAPKEWSLVIAGNDEDGYQKTVEAKIAELGLSGVVTLLGPIFDERKNQAFLQSDLFILPSFSENFGIVVAEALGYSLPVLTTKGCPWRELETSASGWWVEPDPKGILEGLAMALNSSSTELVEMGKRGRALVEERYQWPAIAENMRQFYIWLLEGGRKPKFVV